MKCDNITRASRCFDSKRVQFDSIDIQFHSFRTLSAYGHLAQPLDYPYTPHPIAELFNASSFSEGLSLEYANKCIERMKCANWRHKWHFVQKNGENNALAYISTNGQDKCIQMKKRICIDPKRVKLMTFQHVDMFNTENSVDGNVRLHFDNLWNLRNTKFWIFCWNSPTIFNDFAEEMWILHQPRVMFHQSSLIFCHFSSNLLMDGFFFYRNWNYSSFCYSMILLIPM